MNKIRIEWETKNGIKGNGDWYSESTFVKLRFDCINDQNKSQQYIKYHRICDVSGFVYFTQ